jgi:hypothetical protein
VLEFELRVYTLSHSTSPVLWWVFFKIESRELFCLGWFWTTVLLISASWVARITGVSCWCLAKLYFLPPNPFLPKLSSLCFVHSIVLSAIWYTIIYLLSSYLSFSFLLISHQCNINSMRTRILVYFVCSYIPSLHFINFNWINKWIICRGGTALLGLKLSIAKLGREPSIPTTQFRVLYKNSRCLCPRGLLSFRSTNSQQSLNHSLIKSLMDQKPTDELSCLSDNCRVSLKTEKLNW